MEISITSIDDITVVAIGGELDGKTAPAAQEQVLPLCSAGSRIVLDLNDLTYMSSAGLRLMLMLQRRATASGASIALAGLSEEIRDTMSATGFLAYFAVHERVDSAVSAFAAA